MNLSLSTDPCCDLGDKVRSYISLESPGHTQSLAAQSDNDGNAGMGADLEGLFFLHTTGYSPDEMADALEHLDVPIDELGPLVGVVGFSQDAALALSYVYQQQVESELAPFTFAMCFSSGMPFSGDAGDCQSVIQLLCALRRNRTTTVWEEEAPLTRNERLFSDVLMRTVVAFEKMGTLLPDYERDDFIHGDGSKVPRAIHPQLLKDRIRVPTVHMLDKCDFDFLRNISNSAGGLCEERLTRKLGYSGGHQPPQKATEAKTGVRAAEWAVSQSERVTRLYL